MPVKIHGKDYVTVAERLQMFHEKYKDQTKSILTEIIQFKDGIVVVKAVVKVGEEVYVGHAYEDIGSSKINESSSLENAETSALGRSLKFCLGMDTTESIASAEELVGALNKQKTPYKAKKEDLSGDGWREQPIGFKSGKNEGKSYREVDDETLIWIVEQCKVEAWKEKATKEINIRSGKVEEESKPKVSKEDADSLFE